MPRETGKRELKCSSQRWDRKQVSGYFGYKWISEADTFYPYSLRKRSSPCQPKTAVDIVLSDSYASKQRDGTSLAISLKQSGLRRYKKRRETYPIGSNHPLCTDGFCSVKRQRRTEMMMTECKKILLNQAAGTEGIKDLCLASAAFSDRFGECMLSCAISRRSTIHAWRYRRGPNIHPPSGVFLPESGTDNRAAIP